MSSVFGDLFSLVFGGSPSLASMNLVDACCMRCFQRIFSSGNLAHECEDPVDGPCDYCISQDQKADCLLVTYQAISFC